MLFSQEVKSIREAKTKGQLHDAEQKLKQINEKIINVSKSNETNNEPKRNEGKDWNWTGNII